MGGQSQNNYSIVVMEQSDVPHLLSLLKSSQAMELEDNIGHTLLYIKGKYRSFLKGAVSLV